MATPLDTLRQKLGAKPVALFEAFIGFSLITLLSFWLGSGDRFITFSPHPFWIVILLISCQYGTSEGILAVLLGTIFLYLGNIPERGIEETLYQYELRLAWPIFLWVVVAYILGEIRTGLDEKIRILEKDLKESRRESHTIEEAYTALQEERDYLEAKAATQEQTTTSIFNTFKVLSTLEPTKMLMNLDEVILPALHPDQFSVFFFGPNGFEVATSRGWEEESHYLRRILNDHPLTQAILKKKRPLCVINKEDEEILGEQGILAGPLIDPETHEIFGLLKIEKMNFDRLTIASIEIFRIICELIGLTYSNARQFKKASQSSKSPIEALPDRYLSYQKQWLTKFCNAQSIPLTLLEISFGSQNTEQNILEKLIHFLSKKLPPSAQIIQREIPEKNSAVFLPGYTEKEAENIALQLATEIQDEPQLKEIHLKIKTVKVVTPSGQTKGMVQEC